MFCSISRILSILGCDKIFWAVYKISCFLCPDVFYNITKMFNKREYQKLNLNFRLFSNKKKNLSSSYTFIQLFLVGGYHGHFFLNWAGFFQLSIILNILNFVRNLQEWISSKFFQHLCSLAFQPFQVILTIFHFFVIQKKICGHLPFIILEDNTVNKTLFSGIIWKLSCYFPDYLPD